LRPLGNRINQLVFRHLSHLGDLNMRGIGGSL
jgi:hypothetical protein